MGLWHDYMRWRDGESNGTYNLASVSGDFMVCGASDVLNTGTYDKIIEAWEDVVYEAFMEIGGYEEVEDM
jgi:hypothetical protein